MYKRQIQYNRTERHYELHSILTDLLVQKRGERGAEFERRCLLQAGDFCRDDGQTAAALSLYAQIGDYERMLSLDLSHLTFATINGAPFAELALGTVSYTHLDVYKRQAQA